MYNQYSCGDLKKNQIFIVYIYFRDERPPQSSSPSATPANGRRWVPSSTLKRNIYNEDDRNDVTFRKVRGYVINAI